MVKILVIEDNAEIRENTAELLTINKFLVFTAEGGSEGFVLAKECQPDLILCDIMMPETDGKKFFRLAKEDAQLRQIPIVFFSAGSAQDIQKELVKKADGFLKKPFSEQDLVTVIDKALRRLA